MKINSKISQFSRFLLISEHAIHFKIWKWLKLLNSISFIKKKLVNQVYLRIWSFWLTFTVLQWMKKNSKIGQFSSFLLRSWYPIYVKIWYWLKLLISFPFIKKTPVNHLYIEFDHFDWLSQLYYVWRQTSKLVNLKISAMVWVCDFGQNLKRTKISYFYSIHHENTCKSSLNSNLIILTDFHSFTVNEEKLQY